MLCSQKSELHLSFFQLGLLQISHWPPKPCHSCFLSSLLRICLGVIQKHCWQYFDHRLRTPRESFFFKNWNFWAWADKLGWNFMRHLGYFWPNYKHYFGTVSPLFMGKCSWFSFLQKNLVFSSKTYNSQILPK